MYKLVSYGIIRQGKVMEVQVTDTEDTTQTAPTTLEPGCYIDSHWGHYQTPRTIELALELGWEPRGYTTDEVHTRVAAYNEGEVPPYEETLEDASEHLYWLQEQAEEWINDPDTGLVPEGYWFGHHPDLGDVGVWPWLEDE